MRRNNIIKNIKLAAFIIFITITLYNGQVFAVETYSNKDIQYTQMYLRWLELPDKDKEKYIIPSISPIDMINFREHELSKSPNYNLRNRIIAQTQQKYDLRDVIEITVKNQMNTNSCWAFSANSTLETTIALLNEEYLDFSERHMQYATSRIFLNNDINPNGFNRQVGGGNYRISMPYYTSGQGPILEEEMPFKNNEDLINISEIQNRTVIKKIDAYNVYPTILKEINGSTIRYTNGLDRQSEEYKEYNLEQEIVPLRNMIKEHIVNYGAIGAVMYMPKDSTGFNNYVNVDRQNNTLSVYCNNNSLICNHAITIIGWEDTYSKYNFNENNRPINDGAYIVLNSHGDENVGDGYMYISYDDIYIEYELFGILEATDVSYNNIYQYDQFGASNELFYENIVRESYVANVFNREQINNELLTEIGVYLKGFTEAEIYINPEDDTFLFDKFQNVGKISSKDLEGYYTKKLNIPIQLTGSKFIVAVKYINPLGVEIPVEFNYYTNTNGNISNMYDSVTSNPEESYIYNGVEWKDLSELNFLDTNICIKAFTENKTEPSEHPISSDIYEIEGFYISKVELDTTVQQLKNNIQTIEQVEIYNNNILAQDNETLKTNMTLKVNDIVYYICVTSDVDGDGLLTVVDLSRLKLNSIGLRPLINAFWKAADLNFDGNVNLVDLSKIKRAVVGLN